MKKFVDTGSTMSNTYRAENISRYLLTLVVLVRERGLAVACKICIADINPVTPTNGYFIGLSANEFATF